MSSVIDASSTNPSQFESRGYGRAADSSELDHPQTAVFH